MCFKFICQRKTRAAVAMFGMRGLEIMFSPVYFPPHFKLGATDNMPCPVIETGFAKSVAQHPWTQALLVETI